MSAITKFCSFGIPFNFSKSSIFSAEYKIRDRRRAVNLRKKHITYDASIGTTTLQKIYKIYRV